jgi:hypothetical protein
MEPPSKNRQSFGGGASKDERLQSFDELAFIFNVQLPMGYLFTQAAKQTKTFIYVDNANDRCHLSTDGCLIAHWHSMHFIDRPIFNSISLLKLSIAMKTSATCFSQT